jgi:uncharacterized sulfatase
MNAKPNIIFLFSDQQRWDTLGCNGQPLDITPNLDAMAAEGTQFEHTYTCQPVCGPARACLQTGLYATQLGCYRNGIALPLGRETLARSLSANGYSVGYIGKWHLASNGGVTDIDIGPSIDFHDKPIPPERRGGYDEYWLASDALEHSSHSYDGHMFDRDMNTMYFPEGRYRVDAVTDYVVDYLKGYKGEKPFFLFVSYIEPHHQNDHNKYEGPHGSKEKFKEFHIPGDLINTEGDWRENFADYLGCCHSLDENVGRIQKSINNLGIGEKTIIIYTSDHGSHFRTRNREYKRSCHDSCIRVPLVIKGGQFHGGKKYSELISLLDLPSTILDLAGVPIPEYMQGKSLLPLVEGTAESWREDIFLQISESQVGRAIRTKKWKYSVVAPGKDGARFSKSPLYVEDFLYDVENDPHERTNLVNDIQYVDVRSDLAKRLIAHMVQAGEKIPIILPISQIPKGLEFNISHPLSFVEEEAMLSVKFGAESPLMELPVHEILEEILDIPLIIYREGQKYVGSLIVKDEILYLKDPKEKITRFSPLLSPMNGQDVSFIIMGLDPLLLEEVKAFNPKYALYIMS